MKYLNKISGAGWIGVGVVVGMMLAPAAAMAGSSLVGIIGSTGQRAAVTHAGQLQTAEAPPSAFRDFTTFASTTCHVAVAAPGKQAFIIKDVTADVFSDPSPGGGEKVAFFTTKNCSTSSEVFDINPGSVGVTTIPVDAGFAVPAGHDLWTVNGGSVAAETYITGYLVPKSDVGGFTATVRQAAAHETIQR